MNVNPAMNLNHFPLHRNQSAFLPAPAAGRIATVPATRLGSRLATFSAGSLVVATLLVAPAANAHRTWLLPSATLVDNREGWVTIDAAVSENLFDLDTNGLKLDGITILDPDGQPLAPSNVFKGALRNSFDLKLAKSGTYKVSLVNKSVVASYKLKGEVKRWRGSEEEFLKEVPANAEELRTTRQFARLETFVTAIKPGAWAPKASGSGLEMLAVTHPNDLRSGEKAVWRFLFEGKPLANFAFSLVPGGVRYRGILNELRLTTDANGEASVTLPEAGMYWLNANYPANQGKGANPAMAGNPANATGAAGSAPSAAAPAAGGNAQSADTRRYSYAATLEILPQ